MNKADIREELEALRESNDGLLRAEDVVEYAKSNPDSALHRRLLWDDSAAAHAYRLFQARQLIRVHVIVSESVHMPVRAYVSLTADRKQVGGGYRAIEDVLSDAERKAALLRQALNEAASWREKYKSLKELGEVFAALERVRPVGSASAETSALTVRAAA